MASVVHKECQLIIVGKTGSGKSSLGNSLLCPKGQQPPFEAHMRATSVTAKCQRQGGLLKDGTLLNIVDTPGLFDTTFTIEETEKEIAKSVALCAPGPHAILFVLRIGRFTKEEIDSVDTLMKMFGTNSINYFIVVFTGKDQLDGCNLDEFVKHSPDYLKDFAKQCNSRYVAIANNPSSSTHDSDVKDVMELIYKTMEQNGNQNYTQETFAEAERMIQVEIRRKQQELIDEEIRQRNKRLEQDEIGRKQRLVQDERDRQERFENEMREGRRKQKLEDERIKRKKQILAQEEMVRQNRLEQEERERQERLEEEERKRQERLEEHEREIRRKKKLEDERIERKRKALAQEEMVRRRRLEKELVARQDRIRKEEWDRQERLNQEKWDRRERLETEERERMRRNRLEEERIEKQRQGWDREEGERKMRFALDSDLQPFQLRSNHNYQRLQPRSIKQYNSIPVASHFNLPVYSVDQWFSTSPRHFPLSAIELRHPPASTFHTGLNSSSPQTYSHNYYEDSYESSDEDFF